MLNFAIHWVDIARASLLISLCFYLVFIIGVMALPITLFPIIGGVLFPFWIALPLNVLAATTGAWIAFRLSRALGRHAIEPFLQKRFKSWERVSRMEGFKTVLFLRLIGIPPFIVTNLALGLSGVRQVDFVTATMIGILPWMGIVTYLAQSLWQAVLVGGNEGLAKALAHALGPLFVVSAVILVLVVANHYFNRGRRHSNL